MEPLSSDDPAQVGRYRVHARLGAGGMGTVYLAFTPGGRPVALKMIRPELAGHADFRHRFRQEVETARRVHGLYTAQVLDADPDASPPWLVTAFVPGPSLQEAITAHGPLSVDTALVLMAGVAEALQQIHGAGVIHRDLKPSNVVLSPDGPRVIDFGIARAVNGNSVTGAGLRIGSPNYMAPEQVDDSPVGPAADVFALGSVAAFAALGRPPFGEGGPLPVMYRVLHEPADLAACPAPLRGIVERCLAKRASDRPSPAEIIDRCRAATAGRTGQIAQPWLPPGVLAALAERPLRSPAPAPAAPGQHSASAAARECPAPTMAATRPATPTAPLASPRGHGPRQPLRRPRSSIRRSAGSHRPEPSLTGRWPGARASQLPSRRPGRPGGPGVWPSSWRCSYCRPSTSSGWPITSLRAGGQPPAGLPRRPGSPGHGPARPTSPTALSRTGP